MRDCYEHIFWCVDVNMITFHSCCERKEKRMPGTDVSTKRGYILFPV